MTPTIGRIVLYKLTQFDITAIESRRVGARDWNPLSVGDVFPAIAVAVFKDEFGAGVPGLNLQVFLDGSDSFWATSRREGSEVGMWSWPQRADDTELAKIKAQHMKVG